MTHTLEVARTVKAQKFLDTLIRTSAYGICTRAQRLDQALADGSTIEAVEVRDDVKVRKLEREIEQMRRSDGGWGVPTGNQSHPITIKYNKLKQELADGPTVIEYRLHRADGEYWNVITKTEFYYVQNR